MTVNLQDSDDRKKYLSDKLDDLMDGISGSYGIVLMEELLSRLEQTINEFNTEVQGLMKSLKENNKERNKLIKEIKTKPNSDLPDNLDNNTNEKELSAWEKKLEELDKK